MRIVQKGEDPVLQSGEIAWFHCPELKETVVKIGNGAQPFSLLPPVRPNPDELEVALREAVGDLEVQVAQLRDDIHRVDRENALLREGSRMPDLAKELFAIRTGRDATNEDNEKLAEIAAAIRRVMVGNEDE